TLSDKITDISKVATSIKYDNKQFVNYVHYAIRGIRRFKSGDEHNQISSTDKPWITGHIKFVILSTTGFLKWTTQVITLELAFWTLAKLSIE
ncbi:Hypothetical predicted protein, partial [Paramuricea clavata]